MIPTKEEIQRTLEQRHTKTVQDKLSAAKAAVCGLGGLGSAIAIALARTGIGQLHLIDFDRVDLANLNRQQYAVCDLDTNCILEKLPRKYLVGASGMAGYGDSNSIQTRKILSTYYLCGDGRSEICSEYGLMAPRVMICAAHQANTVIGLILGKEI